ncbi:hypothetical protein DM860_015354 [Cuscuta australis]|uniref:Uncharacterized protein n=1 Tax=Cuscuta australis TaxID=267555 RepID=A0A328DQ34_9ASTE|nr:hypothetical protein DM860_015354 [Cuscuta australis]
MTRNGCRAAPASVLSGNCDDLDGERRCGGDLQQRRFSNPVTTSSITTGKGLQSADHYCRHQEKWWTKDLRSARRRLFVFNVCRLIYKLMVVYGGGVWTIVVVVEGGGEGWWWWTVVVVAVVVDDDGDGR